MADTETPKIYEYEFGPYTLKLRPHDFVMPAELYTTDKRGHFEIVAAMKGASNPCRLLVYLVEHRTTGIENKDIIDHIWHGKSLGDDDNSLYDLFRRLRQILKDNENPPKYIRRGSGTAHFIHPVTVHYQPRIEQQGHREGKLSELRAKHARSKFLFALSEVEAAAGEELWGEVIEIIDTLFESVGQASFEDKTLKQYVFHLRLARVGALGHLGRVDECLSYLTTLDIDEVIRSVNDRQDLVLAAVGTAMLAFERARNPARADEFRDRMWALVAAQPRELYDVAVSCIGFARGLAALDKLYERSIILIDDALDRIKSQTKSKFKVLKAAAVYHRQDCYLKLDRTTEALDEYRNMDTEFKSSSDSEIIGYLAWAGTEATRALRKLGRHGEADTLATSLVQRFGKVNVMDAKKAMAWAQNEGSQTFTSVRDYQSALKYLSTFLERWDTRDLRPELTWPVADAYATKALYLRKVKLYDEAVAQCDYIIERFGTSTDDDIRFVLAWTLLEKAISLRKLKRLSASVSLAKELSERFSEATDQRIKDEVTWALHAEGDALLCEAKALRQTGLVEEGNPRLMEALRRLTAAAERSAEKRGHLACRSYVEFLLGQRETAEQTFAEALGSGKTEWLKEDWTELDMFPIPEDAEYVAATQGWVEKYSNQASTDLIH